MKLRLITDGSDLEGVESTRDIEYIKLLRHSMWLIDSWPKGPNESRVFRIMMVFKWILLVVLDSMYIRNNLGKLTTFDLGHTYITTFMSTVVIVRSSVLLTRKYHTTTLYFLDKMHLLHFRNNSSYAYETHILVHKISNFYAIYIMCMMVMGIFLFNLTPLYNSYAAGMFSSEPNKTGHFDHVAFYALPFDSTTNLYGYIVVAIFNFFISITCSLYFCVLDLSISLMVLHIWGHMRILTYNLNTFPKPASAESKTTEVSTTDVHMYTEEECKMVMSKLRENIIYHSLVLNFVSMMSDGLGVMILIFYLFNQVSGCLLLLMCSQLDVKSLVRYGPLSLIIFQQMIQVSVIFELLGSSNDKLIDAIYSVPWEYMDTKYRKMVFFMLKQSQRSLNLKAMGMVTVGVQTMTAIMKTSFSYFLMLKTIAETE